MRQGIIVFFCLCMRLMRIRIFTCASMRMDPHIYASSAWIRNRMAIPNLHFNYGKVNVVIVTRSLATKAF